MILITGYIHIRPEQHDKAIALGIAHSVRSRAEPGCISHGCHIDAENPDRLVFFEEWGDMAAVRRHFAVPESAEFVRELSGLASEPPVIRLFQADELPRG